MSTRRSNRRHSHRSVPRSLLIVFSLHLRHTGRGLFGPRGHRCRQQGSRAPVAAVHGAKQIEHGRGVADEESDVHPGGVTARSVYQRRMAKRDKSTHRTATYHFSIEFLKNEVSKCAQACASTYVIYPRGAQSQASPGKGATPHAGIMATCPNTDDASGSTENDPSPKPTSPLPSS